jgi:hypothetical protein
LFGTCGTVSESVEPTLHDPAAILQIGDSLIVGDTKDPFRGVLFYSYDAEGIDFDLRHTISLIKMKQAHPG